MTKPDYAEGQVWTYDHRPGEDGSRVAIRKMGVEPEDGEVFHISILGVKLRNHRVPGGAQPAMHHAAVLRTTLDKSLRELTPAADPDTAWENGYAVWRQAYDNGDAGVFELSVAEILGYIERVVAASGEAR
ncbi:MAG TPA: hypothetical protein VM621_02390 [Luteibacter sp.]|uniref:hypothetical protein n=1 Tax=Luteibacter sp. TaxID=1886636 RepID=UPI002B784C1E|nr:hypothetical protein [Luteibacter sp.]HVI53886.1 hypothetical protein [Luteibacter sp.]